MLYVIIYVITLDYVVMSMHSNNFEKAFSSFLEAREYDQIEEVLFSLARTAFLAGWSAAGGEPPMSQRIFQLVQKDDAVQDAFEVDLKK